MILACRNLQLGSWCHWCRGRIAHCQAWSSNRSQGFFYTALVIRYLIQYSFDEILESTVEFGILGGKNITDDSSNLDLHYLMNFIVDFVSWSLQFLEERVQKSKESIDRRETRNSRVSREIYHRLIDVLISDIFSCGLIVLLLIYCV